MRWLFLDPSNLTPLSYNLGNKFNQINGNIEKADLRTDRLTGVPSVRVIESFWFGFGDYCSLSDQIVRLLLNRINGVSDPIPTAVKRMPFEIKQKYFPYFLNLQNFTGLSHILEEVGDCNTKCLPIPKPTTSRDNENGRRQYYAFAYDNGVDVGYAYEQAEQVYYQFWYDLNKINYCCPYVTTY